jgi:cytochrome c biogenesis protein CcdA/thiol-disulfide isomerase/thioredoxin
MEVLLLFAFVSGIITILSPCILPVLPIVLSGGAASGKARPFGVLAGFVASFTVFTLSLSAIVRVLDIPGNALRVGAAVFIACFGAVMLLPRLRDVFERLASRVAGLGRFGSKPTYGAGRRKGRAAGFWSGLPVGLSLGLVWTPCVGPIMASVIGLAVTRQVDGAALFITLAYTLGTSIPMLAVMLGGRALLNRVPWLLRNASSVHRVFGVLMILVGIGIGFGLDRQFQSALLAAFPSYGSGLVAVEDNAPVREALQARESRAHGGDGGGKPGGSSGNIVTTAHSGSEEVFSGAGALRPEGGRLADYGLAPPLLARGEWLNTGGKALRMEQLRGKVVLIDFWTYSCINCVRTLPYLKAWYQRYRDQGLVIIGVHTPEFEFEKDPRNVARAVQGLGVSWPVVLDNDYAQWNAYRNRYWPAHYFIDATGHVRYFHFGEGRYDESEQIIRALLKEAGHGTTAGLAETPKPAASSAGTPETYLGYGRARGFASAVDPIPDRAAEYRPARTPGNAEWTLSGTWTITAQYIEPEDSGVLQLGFRARNVFLVVEPEQAGAVIQVRVDGQVPADTADVMGGRVMPEESRLYQLVGLQKTGTHLLRLDVQGRLRLFAFTFG